MSKSTDEKVTEDLVETLEDGRAGFAAGAEKLEADGRSDLAASFRRMSEQRADFSRELRQMAASYGDQVDENGTAAAKLHRGWMTLKDALTGASPTGVLDAAGEGETHAAKEFESALDEDISDGLRTVVERQLAAIRTAKAEVDAMNG